MTPFLLFGAHAANVNHSQSNQNHFPYGQGQNSQGHAKSTHSAALGITSIDGPASLSTSTSGSWTVNVTTSATTTLHYSAVWGDEGTTTTARAMLARVNTSSTMTHTYTSAGTYHPTFTVTDDAGHTATKSTTVTVGSASAPHLTAVNPTSGVVGSTATLSGTGFASGDTVTVGGVAATNVAYTSDGMITFTVPSLSTGTYNVRVHDGDMRSNPVSFAVTAAAPSLSISGVDAPVRLAVGADGTWTVHAATNASSLHYSVAWGDEGGAMRMMSAAEVTQTSSTFTHAYQAAGTYTPKFTVSDDSGHSESVSATVVVTDNT